MQAKDGQRENGCEEGGSVPVGHKKRQAITPKALARRDSHGGTLHRQPLPPEV